jgi:Carboxypeptidase regulatory-like domain
MEKTGGRRSNMAAGAWAVIVILASPVMLLAQATGTMSGYVKDSSGGVVPQAKVTATLVQRGTTFIAETNAEGFYNFPALDPGEYTLAVEKQGFQRNLQTGLTLTVGQNLRVDASLTVGQLAQEVKVTGQAPLVDTTSGTVSSLVDDRRIVDLPLNGRNVMGLAELVPGVLGVYSPQSLTDARGGPQMNVNGNRGNQNLFTFDGALFINPSRNTGMNLPPPDAVQEFRFQTSNFDAEYGRNSGSQAMVVARAGSNSFHGDVWEFLRNNALNARNFFAPTVPAIKENQFGGTAGGAIKKNKLFFFGAYQGLRDRPQAVANEVLVPSAAERTGDFTDLLPGTVLTNPVNPNTGQPFTTPSGAPCVANNIVDPSCITTPSKNLLQYVPVTPSNTVVSLGSSPVNDNMYLGRIDVIISPKQTLFGHAFVDKNSSSTAFPAGSNIAGYNSASRPAETDDFAVNDTYTFKPTLVNQAVVSFLRTTSTFQLAQTVAPMTLGINMPQYVPNGTIGANVSGSFNLNGSGFNLFKNNNWQFRDSLTWTKGRHTFKMGGEVLPLHFLQRFIGTPGFSFTGSRSGDAFADYLLGAFSTMSVGFGIADNDDVTTALSFFFQDQFKATPASH